MMSHSINNFVVLESIYGKFVVNRHCTYQADVLIKTGFTHIEAELGKILTIINLLPEECIVVDAGANVGLVSIPIARQIKSKGSIVHAFEVQRMMFYALCGSAALNDLDNLHAYNIALGDEIDNLSVVPPDYGVPQDFGLYSLVKPLSGNLRETAAVVPLDTMNLPRLDFLKIDVEGMEPAVLRGARNTIREYEPWCWVEFWRSGIAEIKASFAGLNYKFFPMDNLNLLCSPVTRLATAGIHIDGCEI